MADGMIIEDSANRYWRVSDQPNPDITHAWIGIEVKRVRTRMGDYYQPKAKARPILVRKAATQIIEEF